MPHTTIFLVEERQKAMPKRLRYEVRDVRGRTSEARRLRQSPYEATGPRSQPEGRTRMSSSQLGSGQPEAPALPKRNMESGKKDPFLEEHGLPSAPLPGLLEGRL